MISFIVPAHNEQGYLGRTLAAIHESARAAGQPYEVIVVDDASTDATSEIARQNGARVVSVAHRQIAATRNSGARAASGETLIFVDADTTINPSVVSAAVNALNKGAAGGAPPRFDETVPLYMRLLLVWFNLIMRLVGITGGACMFCTQDAFHAVGGFDERLFGAEDAAMSFALKREGRYVVLWEHVLTSGRRARGLTGLQMLAVLVKMAFFPWILRRRSAVEKIWYDSNRDGDDRRSSSWVARLANGIALAIVLVFVTGPIWDLIPWSLTPRDSLLGALRVYFGIFCCHVALVLWPCIYFLIRILLRQKRWPERVKLVALIALCLLLAWSSTRDVILFWMWVYHGFA